MVRVQWSLGYRSSAQLCSLDLRRHGPFTAEPARQPAARRAAGTCARMQQAASVAGGRGGCPGGNLHLPGQVPRLR